MEGTKAVSVLHLTWGELGNEHPGPGGTAQHFGIALAFCLTAQLCSMQACGLEAEGDSVSSQ